MDKITCPLIDTYSGLDYALHAVGHDVQIPLKSKWHAPPKACGLGPAKTLLPTFVKTKCW